MTNTKTATKTEMLETLDKFIKSKFGKNHEYAPTVKKILDLGEKAKKADIQQVYDHASKLVEDEKAKRKAASGNETLRKPGAKKTAPAKAETEDQAPAPKESAKKAEPKAEKRKNKLVPAKGPSKYSDSTVKMFPDVIEHPNAGTLLKADHIRTYNEVKQMIEEGKVLYIAAVWTKTQVKKYDYGNFFRVKHPTKGFDNDLDILQALFCCETMERVWCISRNTEAVSFFEGSDFIYMKDKDQTGEEFEIRVSNGLEFELYVPEDEE